MINNQRISNVINALTLPFIDDSYLYCDLLLKKAIKYNELKEAEFISSDMKQEYSKCKDDIIKSFFKNNYIEKFDNIEQLLALFYSEVKTSLEISEQYYSIDDYYFEIITKIALSFVCLRDGKVSIRMWNNENPIELFKQHDGFNKVELWNALSRVMTPDIFIAKYFAESDINDIEYLTNVHHSLNMKDIPISNVLSNGIAETHLHMNAALSYSSVWSICTDITRLKTPEKFNSISDSDDNNNSRNVVFAGVLRLLITQYIEKSKDEDILCFYENNLTNESFYFELLQFLFSSDSQDYTRESFDCKSEELVKKFFSNKDSIIENIHRDFDINREKNDIDVLFNGIYSRYKHLNTTAEIIFLYKTFEFINKNEQFYQVKHLLLQYIRLKSNFFKTKFQSYQVRGLKYFLDFFENATNAATNITTQNREKSIYYAIIKDQCNCSNLKKIEMKISPKIRKMDIKLSKDEIKMNTAKQLFEILSAYLEYIESIENKFAAKGQKVDIDKIVVDEEASIPTLGLVYHFIKVDDPDNYIAKTCWVFPSQYEYLENNYIEDSRKRHKDFLDALRELLSQIPHLSEYVVGIDAAADEIGEEPWHFAPVFTHARRRKNTLPINLETQEYIQNLGFTYHVGEDYRHILSGLRHIDEVITHFGYKSGDRLGHALALQISPEKWIQNNEIVAIPIFEYFENLIWLWGIINNSEIRVDSYLELDVKIMDIAKQLFSSTVGITPYTLWSAYKQKFKGLDNDFVEKFKEAYVDTNNINQNYYRRFCVFARSLNCDKCANGSIITTSSDDIVWTDEKLLMTNFCPCYISSFREPLFVKTKNIESELISKVQYYLREKIQNQGIYIEVNPSSNSTIGDVDSLSEHPIFDIIEHDMNVINGQLLFSVNSDDSLIFNTDIESEISNVYHILIKKGYSRVKILNIIERIRRYGMESSFIRKEKLPSIQRDELRSIILSLKKLLNR